MRGLDRAESPLESYVDLQAFGLLGPDACRAPFVYGFHMFEFKNAFHVLVSVIGVEVKIARMAKSLMPK